MPGSPIVDIRNSFGAAFIGLLVSNSLFGLTVIQTWIYFWNYRKRDPMALKLLVAFVAIMDATHTILCCYAIYWYLVLNFGNVENLGFSMWAMNFQVIISITVGASVQLYYAKLVYTATQSIIFPIVIIALIVVGSSLGFLSTAQEIVSKRFSSLHSVTWVTGVGMASGTLANMLIAAVMCWSLYRKRAGFARTHCIIITLMAYSINSGLLTSFLAAAMTISFAVSPFTMIWLTVYWATSKCYANTLLALLNSRDYICGRSNSENALNSSSIRIEPLSDTYGAKSGQRGVSVTVHRSTALNFARNKSDHDVRPSYDVTKPDASIDPFQRPNVGIEYARC